MKARNPKVRKEILNVILNLKNNLKNSHKIKKKRKKRKMNMNVNVNKIPIRKFRIFSSTLLREISRYF